MPQDPEVTTIKEIRGTDGSTAYEVSGGKPGEGAASYVISKEAFHAAEREGKERLKDVLRNGIQTTLDYEHGRS